MTFIELVEKLNEFANTKEQTAHVGDFMEDLPEELYAEFEKFKFVEIKAGLGIDKHRWYEVSTVIFKDVDNNLLGVSGVSNIFSESMGYDDCGWSYGFSEMVEQLTVSYIEKPRVEAENESRG